MKRKAGSESGKQVGALRSVLLPMVAGIAATRNGLMEFVHDAGLRALAELLRADAEDIAGPKGKHRATRQYNHWGTAPSELTFGGRRISVRRPRVRSRNGGERELPSVREFQEVDPLPERVVEQILLGVSTRGYEPSLDAAPPGVRSRGTSKSAASRHLVERTATKMRDHLTRRLEDLDLIGLFIDGIEFVGHTVVVALGVTLDGTKVPLGLWLGGTESAAVCTALVSNLVERGLRIDDQVLCVIDGGKAIRKALGAVLGDRAVIQRCQVHKSRNVLDQLPDSRRPYVRKLMRDAYRSGTFDTARRRLKQLASWLEKNGEVDAAASLREGMDETLTVLKLDLPATLCRTFATTNPIENMNGTVRRVSRNVKRWRGGGMIKRWVALGVIAAQRKFRRIKGHRDLPILIRALRGGTAKVDSKKKAA